MSASKEASSNGSRSASPWTSGRSRAAGAGPPRASRRSGRRPTTEQPVRRTSSQATAPVPVATSRTVSAGPDASRETRKRPPARVLTEARAGARSDRTSGRAARTARSRGRVPGRRGRPRGRVYADPSMALSDDLRRIADVAVAYAADGEELSAVIPTEPAAGVRVYLCAFAAGESQALARARRRPCARCTIAGCSATPSRSRPCASWPRRRPAEVTCDELRAQLADAPRDGAPGRDRGGRGRRSTTLERTIGDELRVAYARLPGRGRRRDAAARAGARRARAARPSPRR